MRLRSVIPRSRERADEESPSLCSRLLTVWGPSGFALGMTGVSERAAPQSAENIRFYAFQRPCKLQYAYAASISSSSAI